MVESGLFTFFPRPAQAYVWTKTKAFYQSCTLYSWFLVSVLKVPVGILDLKYVKLIKLDNLNWGFRSIL